MLPPPKQISSDTAAKADQESKSEKAPEHTHFQENETPVADSLPCYIIKYMHKPKDGLHQQAQGYTTDEELWMKILAKFKANPEYEFQTDDKDAYKVMYDSNITAVMVTDPEHNGVKKGEFGHYFSRNLRRALVEAGYDEAF